MSILLYTLHILTSLFLILVVLLQQGKGADLSVFGGGNTMTAFGARGAASLLHKMTVIGFVLFIFTTLAIGVVQGRGGSSVMTGVIDEESAVEAQASEDAAAGDVEGEPTTEEPGGVFSEADDPAASEPSGSETGGESAPDNGAAEDAGAGGGTESSGG